MVFDFLENPVQADDEVEAVHNEAHTDEADERELLVAESAAGAC